MITAKVLLAYLLHAFNAVPNTEEVNFQEAYCLAENIYFEAKGENVQGQFAVAWVTVNRKNDPRFPDTICKVVKQSVFVKNLNRRVCSFSWYCDDNMRLEKMSFRKKDGSLDQDRIDQFQIASLIAIKVLSGKEKDNTRGATHFYNPSIASPAWRNELPKTVKVGNHDFHRLPGSRV